MLLATIQGILRKRNIATFAEVQPAEWRAILREASSKDLPPLGQELWANTDVELQRKEFIIKDNLPFPGPASKKFKVTSNHTEAQHQVRLSLALADKMIASKGAKRSTIPVAETPGTDEQPSATSTSGRSPKKPKRKRAPVPIGSKSNAPVSTDVPNTSQTSQDDAFPRSPRQAPTEDKEAQLRNKLYDDIDYMIADGEISPSSSMKDIAAHLLAWHGEGIYELIAIPN